MVPYLVFSISFINMDNGFMVGEECEVTTEFLEATTGSARLI